MGGNQPLAEGRGEAVGAQVTLAGLGGAADCLNCASVLVREIQVKLTDFRSQRKT